MSSHSSEDKIYSSRYDIAGLEVPPEQFAAALRRVQRTSYSTMIFQTGHVLSLERVSMPLFGTDKLPDDEYRQVQATEDLTVNFAEISVARYAAMFEQAFALENVGAALDLFKVLQMEVRNSNPLPYLGAIPGELTRNNADNIEWAAATAVRFWLFGARQVHVADKIETAVEAPLADYVKQHGAKRRTAYSYIVEAYARKPRRVYVGKALAKGYDSVTEAVLLFNEAASDPENSRLIKQALARVKALRK